MRLNNQIREKIADSEIEKKFGKDWEKPLLEEIRLEIVSLIKKTIPSWISQNKIDSEYIKMSNDYDIPSSMKKEIPANERMIYNGFHYLPSFPCKDWEHTITPNKKMTTTARKIIDTRNKVKEYRRELYAVLASTNSKKKLVELIPEFEEYFVEDFISKELVPAENIKELRAEIKEARNLK